MTQLIKSSTLLFCFVFSQSLSKGQLLIPSCGNQDEPRIFLEGYEEGVITLAYAYPEYPFYFMDLFFGDYELNESDRNSIYKAIYLKQAQIEIAK